MALYILELDIFLLVNEVHAYAIILPALSMQNQFQNQFAAKIS